MKQEITLKDFSKLHSIEEGFFSDIVRNFFNSIDTSYQELLLVDQNNAILQALKQLEKKWLKRDEEDNLKAFENGWSENLQKCKEDGLSIASLTPGYVKPFDYMRYNKSYIVSNNPLLFDDLCTASLLHIFTKYFNDSDNIYEFGCGTGRYLYRLSEIYPEKQLMGLDWAKPAVDILKMMKKEDKKVDGLQFNMLAPPNDFQPKEASAFYTVGAMEQLGSKFQPFLDFIYKSKPKIVVHHEPVSELYNQDNLIDYLAYKYHVHRGYLFGYLDKLRELEKAGKAEIIFAKKLGYGDKFNDGSSLIIWMPKY